MNIFTVNGAHYKSNCLPGLNDLLREAERHPIAYNRLEKEMETIIISCIRRDLRGWKPNGLCQLNIVYGEKSKGNRRYWYCHSRPKKSLAEECMQKRCQSYEKSV